MEAFDAGLIEEIVRRILEEKMKNTALQKFDKAADESGVLLVKGSTVRCNPFDTGKAGDKVFLRDIFTLEESPRMACGFMEMEASEFDWTLVYDEIDYIIEGTLEITIDGRKMTGKAGDVFLIPKDTTIKFGCPDKVRFLYVTYPANWEQLVKERG